MENDKSFYTECQSRLSPIYKTQIDQFQVSISKLCRGISNSHSKFKRKQKSRKRKRSKTGKKPRKTQDLLFLSIINNIFFLIDTRKRHINEKGKGGGSRKQKKRNTSRDLDLRCLEEHKKIGWNEEVKCSPFQRQRRQNQMLRKTKGRARS